MIAPRRRKRHRGESNEPLLRKLTGAANASTSKRADLGGRNNEVGKIMVKTRRPGDGPRATEKTSRTKSVGCLPTNYE